MTESANSDIEQMDAKVLDEIIKDTITAVEKGKNQIYDIAENARREYERVQRESEQLKREVVSVIDEVDRLEQKERQARVRLMEVSRSFDKYSESDIKKAYDAANEMRVQLLLAREKESQLRAKRDELELNLKKIEEMVLKAENLVSQVGVVLQFLNSNLQDLSTKLEGAQQRQQLGLKIIKAQEEERKRVAREIHDGPAQAMANIVLRAEVCEKLLKIKPQQVEGELKELKSLVKESLQDLRKVIFDLRPMTLDDLGIAPTLRRYLTDFQEKNNMTVELVVHGRENRHSSAVEVAVFRTIQEGVTNIKKHSKAKMSKIIVEFTLKQINISIVDNGVGFEVDKVVKDLNRDSYGLISMRERVELLEGELNIRSSPGKGTEIKAIIPIQD